MSLQPTAPGARPDGDRSLLIVDDDKPFLTRLARAMESARLQGRGGGIGRRRPAAPSRPAPPAFAVIDMRLADGNGLDVISELKAQAARRARHHPDRLRQHRHRRDGGEARRLRLSRQARRRRRDLRRPDGDRGTTRPSCPKTRCRPTACAGSTSSASTSSAAATSRRRRAASTCTAARCSASWPSARRAEAGGPRPHRGPGVPENRPSRRKASAAAMAAG